MFPSLKVVFVFLLVLSSTIANKKLEETKTWLECAQLCMKDSEIMKEVPNCTLECKKIFNHQFERKTGR